jgi:ubiquinone/menaquinone biosynthesis C-methylase UbiE
VEQEFADVSGNYARLAWRRARREARQFIAWIKPKRNERILDAACGPSVLGRALLPHVEQVCGLDLSLKMLEQASGDDARSSRRLLQTAGTSNTCHFVRRVLTC